MHSSFTAVVPVAGLGTRFLPATKMVPKELLVLIDRPLVQYGVEELVAAGIDTVIFVDSPAKQGRIERHFSPMPWLNDLLEKADKKNIKKRLANAVPQNVKFITVLQDEPLGLGHAILQSASIVRSDYIVILLPDIIMSDQRGEDLQLMMSECQSTGKGQVMLQKVDMAEVNCYGIADIKNGERSSTKSCEIKELVEKPAPESAPSNWAISGRYVLPTSIFSYLESIERGVNNEFQLTDALNKLCSKEGLNGWLAINDVHDCGNRLGYLKANHYFASQHEELGSEYLAWLKKQLK